MYIHKYSCMLYRYVGVGVCKCTDVWKGLLYRVSVHRIHLHAYVV